MADRQDHRSEPRLALRIPVFVELPESEDDELTAPLLLCRLVDFSANGAQIRLDRSLPEGRSCDCRLNCRSIAPC